MATKSTKPTKTDHMKSTDGKLRGLNVGFVHYPSFVDFVGFVAIRNFAL